MADVIGSFGRGYSLGDSIMGSMEDRERRAKQDAQRDKIFARQEKQWGLEDEDRERRLAREGEELEWQDTVRAQKKKEWGQQDKLHTANLEQAQSAKELNQYNLRLQKKTQYQTENMPLIQQKFSNFLETGEIDPIFDNEFVQGTPYDPRSWTDDKYNSGMYLSSVMPSLMSGDADFNDPKVIENLGEFYKPNVEGVIGEVDGSTGKTITGSKLSRIDRVEDIDPNTPGNQIGFVLTTEVTYDDGTKAIKPVTENRNSDPNDRVKVIPLEGFMNDMTGQLTMMRDTMASGGYQAMFVKENSGKSKTELVKQYNKTLDDLAKKRTDALANAVNEEDAKRVNASFDLIKQQITDRYNPLISDDGRKSPPPSNIDPKQWAKDSKQIRQFANQFSDVPADVVSEMLDEYKSGRSSMTDILAYLDENYDAVDTDKKNEGVLASIASDVGGKAKAGYQAVKREVDSPSVTPETEKAIDAPPEQLKEYEQKTDDELMALVNEGDKLAIRVLRNRNIERNEGQYVGLGAATDRRRETGRSGLEEYNRLMAAGRTEEANQYLANLNRQQRGETTSLAQATPNSSSKSKDNGPETNAMLGELGVIKNKNGSISTEYSITENIPELGGWVNIPTLVKGQNDLSFLETGELTQENIRIAIQRAIERVKGGASLPSYKSLDQAVAAAEGRTEEEKTTPYA